MAVRELKQRKGFLLFSLAVALGPWIIRSNYMTSVMILIAIYGVLSLGMELLMGQTGLFSLAHPTWFGLGAYVSGIAATRGILPPMASIVAAGGFAAVVAFVIGAPVLRLKGFYLACATFAIIIVAQVAAAQWTGLTGGPEGLVGIPALRIAGYTLTSDLQFYYLSWFFCLVCYLFCSNLAASRVGRALRALRDSELASSSVGIHVSYYKLQVFVLTATMAAVAGGIFCFYLRFVVPDSFGFPLLLELLMMTIMGGLGDLRGALVGTFSVIWLKEALNAYLRKGFPSISSEVDVVFFGLLIIVVLIFMPKGLVGGMDQVATFLRREIGRER